MPRKKITVPVLYTNGPKATRATRTKKVLTDFRSETGDPWEDGEVWLARIVLTRQARAQRRNGEKDWRRYYRWFEGEQWDNRGGMGAQVSSDNPRETATVNKTGSIANSIVPFLINDEIKFLLEPEKPVYDQGRGVRIQESLLNYEWRRRGMTEQMKKCARDKVIIGHCVAKTGYTVEVDEARKVEKNGVINYADYIRKDAPWVERVNPLDFIFDLSAKDHSLHTARWCAEVFFEPYADVLSNKSYDRETLGELRSGNSAVSTKAAWEHLGVDQKLMRALNTVTLPEDNLVTLIEIWDKKYQKRIIYADGCPRPLLVGDWPYLYLDNFPYAMANYIDVPNQPYGMGLPRWIEDQQLQLNRMATLEQDIARKSRPRHAASETTAPEEIQKWQNGDDIIIGDIKPIQHADLLPSFQQIQANIERAIEQMTGADALLQGARLPSRTTAGEIGTRARLTGLKLDQHVEDFEEFVEDIAGQVLHHLKKHRTVADVIEIVGPDGAEWHSYTNEQIQDDVDVDVEYFSAPKTDPALEIQQRKDILQLLVSAMPVMAERTDKVPDIPNVVEWVLDAYGEKDTGRFFRPLRIAGAPQGQGAGPGAGLPPELAGALAPGPMGQNPGVGQPGAGLSLQDLMMGANGGR